MFKILLELLSPSERIQGFFLVLWVLIVALMDVAGIASIMPFIAVLTNPELIQTNEYLAMLYDFSGYSDAQEFLFLLGVIVFSLLVISLSLKALTTYIQTRFTLKLEYSLGRRLLFGYLHQPYEWFLNRNSSELGKSILSEVYSVIKGGFAPLMTVITQSIVAATILVLLLLVNTFLALMVFITLSFAYLFIYKVLKRLLLNIGQSRFDANQKRYNIISEIFGGIKDIKLGELEELYLDRFSRPSFEYAKSNTASQVINLMPRFALEAIAFGGMLLMILYMMGRGSGLGGVLPVIALYALAGYRLMPALQQLYEGFSKLRFSVPAIEALHKDLIDLKVAPPVNNLSSFKLAKSIELKDITFSYPETEKYAISGVSLTIPALSTIGIVGSTGSGKTTIVDIILGLLSVDQGILKIDDQIINNDNFRKWQKIIGYVPQQIYLSDSTVAANIAFGSDAKNINQDAVKHAAKIANLHDFIINQLPDGYQTTVGERGVRLSGGQRQRIGIARALYRSPKVLFFDEATSALDNLTEHAVMDAVRSLEHKITIIMIAHRLSTVKHCDKIFFLEKGKIKAQGTYDELMQQNEIFRSMVEK